MQTLLETPMMRRAFGEAISNQSLPTTNTAAEAKASRNLLYKQSKGLITLSAEDLERHEGIYLADERRKQLNRDRLMVNRHYANPANRSRNKQKLDHSGQWNGAFGNDMSMDDARRDKTYDAAEGRTPREIHESRTIN